MLFFYLNTNGIECDLLKTFLPILSRESMLNNPTLVINVTFNSKNKI